MRNRNKEPSSILLQNQICVCDECGHGGGSYRNYRDSLFCSSICAPTLKVYADDNSRPFSAYCDMFTIKGK